jgi:hypothetical protein
MCILHLLPKLVGRFAALFSLPAQKANDLSEEKALPKNTKSPTGHEIKLEITEPHPKNRDSFSL